MCRKYRAIYDYYETYLTEIVDALILYNYEDGLEERIPVMATYVFIVELVIFQNTSLNKMTQKLQGRCLKMERFRCSIFRGCIRIMREA